MSDQDEVVASLVAERYGRSHWWRVPPPRQADTETAMQWDDSEATCARRRRQMAADFARLHDETEVSV